MTPDHNQSDLLRSTMPEPWLHIVYRDAGGAVREQWASLQRWRERIFFSVEQYGQHLHSNEARAYRVVEQIARDGGEVVSATTFEVSRGKSLDLKRIS
jgi:hypothetical protein